MSAPACFATIAPRLLDNGWPSVIPLDGKRPLIPGWQRYNAEPVPEAEVEEWCRRWPWANVGLPLGLGVVAIDVDIEAPDLAERTLALADEILGPTPAIRIGRAPRFARVYRGNIASRKRHPVEVFGNSGQLAIYGTHPATGLPYFWPDSEPLSLAPDDLPAVEAPAVEAFVADVLDGIEARTGRSESRPAANCDLFAELRERRRGLRGDALLIECREQLRAARPGELHDVLVSVTAALAWREELPEAYIKRFVEAYFAAPRTGPYAAVWQQVDGAIASARAKRRVQPRRAPWEVRRHG